MIVLIKNMKKYLFTTFLILLTLPSVFGQYRIVYNVAKDSKNDDYEVYSMNVDGSDKRNITEPQRRRVDILRV